MQDGTLSFYPACLLLTSSQSWLIITNNNNTTTSIIITSVHSNASSIPIRRTAVPSWPSPAQTLASSQAIPDSRRGIASKRGMHPRCSGCKSQSVSFHAMYNDTSSERTRLCWLSMALRRTGTCSSRKSNNGSRFIWLLSSSSSAF